MYMSISIYAYLCIHVFTHQMCASICIYISICEYKYIFTHAHV